MITLHNVHSLETEWPILTVRVCIRPPWHVARPQPYLLFDQHHLLSHGVTSDSCGLPWFSPSSSYTFVPTWILRHRRDIPCACYQRTSGPGCRWEHHNTCITRAYISQWHQLDHMQTIHTSLQTTSYHSTFYRPYALPDAQPTVPKHWRQQDINLLVCQHLLQASRIWILLNKLLLFIHRLRQGVNLNQHSTVQTAHMCVHINVHNCCTHNSSDNLPSYPPDNHQCWDAVTHSSLFLISVAIK